MFMVTFYLGLKNSEQRVKSQKAQRRPSKREKVKVILKSSTQANKTRKVMLVAMASLSVQKILI